MKTVIKNLLFVFTVVCATNAYSSMVCYPNYGGSDCFYSRLSCGSWNCPCGSCSTAQSECGGCCCSALLINVSENCSGCTITFGRNDNMSLDVIPLNQSYNLGSVNLLELASNEIFRFNVNYQQITRNVTFTIYDSSVLESQVVQFGYVTDVSAAFVRTYVLYY